MAQVQAEGVLRHVLRTLPAGDFQQVMRVVSSRIIPVLEAVSPEDDAVDLGLLLAVLAAAARGTLPERLEAAYQMLSWRSGGGALPRAHAALFVAVLEVGCFVCIVGLGAFGGPEMS